MWWGGLGEERCRSPPIRTRYEGSCSKSDGSRGQANDECGGGAWGRSGAAPPQSEQSMKAVAVNRNANVTPDALEGRIACHDVRDQAGKVTITKGQTLDGAAAARLLTLPWEEVHLLELEPGDVHEEPAGSRL